MPIVTTINGKVFECNAQESLLDAALRSQIVLEHSCKTGRCGACRAKATVGATLALLDESSLTLREKLSGWILTCARTAVADVKLQVEDLGDYKLSAAKTVPCRIHTLEKLAPDVVKVVLRLPPQQLFSYLPGQYIDVIGPGSIRRSYSVANALNGDKLIELHIRQVQGGSMSQYWFGHAQPNDLLRLNGPLGTFFLRSVAGMHLAFMATGTGIAPVKAMLEGLSGLAQSDLPQSISVYWGGRIEQDLYWQPESALVDHQFMPVLSRPGSGWNGLRGYVQTAFLASNPDLLQTVVYACGSDAMIHSARQALTAAGLPENRFLSDAFVASSNNPIK
jgi:CDP-4-dehydro-6-deoxyglucose reductase